MGTDSIDSQIRSRRFSRAGLLIAFVLAVSATRAAAQDAGDTADASGVIRGQVVDAQHAALPGVTVTAAVVGGRGTPQVAVTDGEGRYVLAVPPGGTYTVVAELSGFARFTRSEIVIAGGERITVDIQLELGGLTETIQVVGNEVTRSRNTIERVQDVPQSISIVSGVELERLEATGIAAITQRVANVSWNYGNQRTSSLSIRGVGKQGQTEAQDPSVGVIVDGVPYAYNALTSSYDFTDVEAVEVTRGPQGTLLGKNSSLGVVNVTTRPPSFTPTAEGSLSFGQFNTVLGRLAVGGPLTNHIAWRGTVSVSKGGGDIQNAYNRDVTYTNMDRVSGRAQVLVVPNPGFSAKVTVDVQPRGGETTNGRTINLPTPTTYANGTPTNLTTDPSTRLARRWFTQQGSYSYERDFLFGGGQNAVNNDIARGLVTGSNGVAAVLTWNLGSHTLTSISALKNYHFNAVNDEGTPFDIQRNSGGFWNDYRQITQEARVSGARGTTVNYQFGVFYIDVLNDVDYRRIWGNDAGAWYANPTQYARLDVDAAGRYLMQQSLDRLSMSFNSPTGVQSIRNRSAAPFAQANWHLSPALTVTTGLRFTREDRRNHGYTAISDHGYAPELNPVAVNGVQLGGFAATSAGALTAANSVEQLRLADSVASKYFGVAPTTTPGAGYSLLTAAQRQQVADAKAIRAAQIGVLFNPSNAERYRDVQPSYLVSPLYKVTEQINLYASWQYGEKAGISQFTNGISNLARPERSRAYELGVKSVLFNRTLLLNTDFFLTDIRDYQQGVRVLDAYTTNLNNDGQLYYTTATGNVPRVRVKGLEIDGIYAGIRHTTIRFAGAITSARYAEFPNSAQPNENGSPGAAPYRDVSGEFLPGASRLTFNVGAEYRLPLRGDKNIHASANTSCNSRYNSDNSLSVYGWIPARSLTDIAIGFGRQRFDVSLLVKNVFNDKTAQTRSWNSYTPALPRWVGVQFTSKL